jgi:hypothetical protein
MNADERRMNADETHEILVYVPAVREIGTMASSYLCSSALHLRSSAFKAFRIR